MAIIVGSIPASVSFLRKHVGESSVYKSLRSKIFSSNLGSKDSWNKKTSVETYRGSGKQKRKLSYYTLSDETTLRSHITVPSEAHMYSDNRYHDGMVRTVAVTQQEHNTASLDRMV